MRAVHLVLAAGACAEPSASQPDAPIWYGPMQYRLAALDAEPVDRPKREPAPVILIDGAETERLELEYPSEADAHGSEHVIELRVGDVVISERTTIDTSRNCLASVDEVREYSVSYCVYASGDIRFASDQVTGSGVCYGDGLCFPDCHCEQSERCTSRVISTDPFVSRLGCAPIGPKGLGSSCTLVADPDGAYDDCGAKLLCVAGACRRLCDRNDPSCECRYVEGHAPELQICD